MRKYLFYKILLCSLALSIICSCASSPPAYYGSVDVVKTGSGFYEPTNPNDVRILKTIPDRKYVEVGTVIVSIWYEGGDVTIMHNDIRTESAVLGADAVILTDEGFLPIKDSSDYKYWATGVAVKFE